ncbi:hypothetical protein [Shewanella sp. KT0246]|uniref:hypothetical protein n=1 Tax=Shewanella sp. KT0246 TaxID=2815912 RepID=UPI001BC0FCB2|nr:hypothetical protein [Shewanella sp. KT0246]GIU51209.1 hypothetical protein TUM4249_15070 [Shewanella sp. KT0246]
MQVQSSVNSYQVNTSSSVDNNTAVAQPIATSTIAQSNPQSDTVNLSAKAISLSEAAKTHSEPETQPTLPNDGEKVENYVHYKKAQAQYQFYSDLAGVANGNDGSMSATSVYMVKNNDDARAATVQAANMNNQQDMLNTYIETTQSINESV